MNGWEVSVSVNGEDILTISDQHLSGIDNVLDFDEEINEAARNLLGFIGKDIEYHHDCFYRGGRGCMNLNLSPDHGKEG